MQKSPGEGWSSAFIPASPCSGQTAPRASHCSAGCANRVAGWVGDSPGGSVTATEGPPMGQNNTQLAQVPRQHRVHVPDAGTATGAVLALLEAGTAPHMMQGQLSVPFGSALPAGLRFEAPDPRVFSRTGQPPPEPDRVSGVSWAGTLPLAVPTPLQQPPLSRSAIPMAVSDAQGGSRGCANTILASSRPPLPCDMVPRVPHKRGAAQGSCHVQPRNESPLSPRSCWVAGTESGWRFAKRHPKALWAAGTSLNTAQADRDSAHSPGVTAAPVPWACSHPL